jgi:hypothetical protein
MKWRKNSRWQSNSSSESVKNNEKIRKLFILSNKTTLKLDFEKKKWLKNPRWRGLHNSTRFFFRELNSTIFNWIWAADYDCVLGFFPACQVSEIILNESPKNTENAVFEWLRKETTSIRGLFGFESSFWKLFSTSGSSKIC